MMVCLVTLETRLAVWRSADCCPDVWPAGQSAPAWSTALSTALCVESGWKPIASGSDSETICATRGLWKARPAEQGDVVVSDLPKLQNETAEALLARFLPRQGGPVRIGHLSQQAAWCSHGYAYLVVLHLQFIEVTFEQLMLPFQLVVCPLQGGRPPGERLVLIRHGRELRIRAGSVLPGDGKLRKRL